MGAKLVPGELTLEVRGKKLRVGSAVEMKTDKGPNLASIEQLDLDGNITVTYDSTFFELISLAQFEKRFMRVVSVSELVDVANRARSV